MVKRHINLAFQGGGSHGAYTWGVVDRLLEEEDIVIHSISGTSAGAMNAVITADGYREGGRDGAKKRLHDFWHEVSRAGAIFNPNNRSDMESMFSGWNIDESMNYQWYDMMSRMFSPYQLNPFNINPLEEVLDRFVDWKRINAGGDIHLFITATAVETGRPRVFRCHEITRDVMLASACIPIYFQSVEIDGEPYWDGGYMGNPSIWPLIYYTDISDVMLVQINPIIRKGTPKTAQDIINRLNEITFNSSLISEMRAINFVAKLVEEHQLDTNRYRQIHMHMIESPDEKHGLNASSKANTDWDFLQFLHEIGRKKADSWLRKHQADIGNRSTIDIADVFLGKRPDQQARKATPKPAKKPAAKRIKT